MVLKKNLRDKNHEDRGQIPRQQLPSIQEIFGDTYPLAIPSGQSYARPSDTSQADPPALPVVYGIEHSNEGAPSIPPNESSLNEPCRFSMHPDLPIPQAGSFPCGPVDSAQPSFAEPQIMFQIPIWKKTHLIPPESQYLCQPKKQTPSSLDFSLSFNVVRNYYDGQPFQQPARPFSKIALLLSNNTNSSMMHSHRSRQSAYRPWPQCGITPQ